MRITQLRKKFVKNYNLPINIFEDNHNINFYINQKGDIMKKNVVFINDFRDV